ncbi:putative multicopper oxidase [Nostoc sp. PCC 7524]|uniref:multicopper oxidase family protein n=1 Tax=Nostoc sp. (strain ATCC 29411 / PCC 7524) TaxID=28072 RepID=UPI00029F06B8|nr:multicopper oxidase family protein [Nostoc sp. PCC 7524]AFY46782.1 putative multicopper oxidase [Nostoc sp. PCC 7524]
MMKKLNRRQFITLTAASAGTAIAASWVWQKIHSSQIAAQPQIDLPKLHKSTDGLLEINLEASNRAVKLGDQQAYLLTYNGQIPAPRLEAKPGDTVRIRFTNNLAQSTNLHYHGLHIPPTGSADNVFLSIDPEENFNYEFTIPANHPASTFWYHPHRHGFVAEQLFGGLAGLFVVRGELDEIPEIKAAKEEFLVLQDFALDGEGRLMSSAHMSMMTGREGDIITVNGQSNPSFSLPAQGLVRWRILNASTSRFYLLALEKHPFYLIATEGGALEQPVEVRELLLTPGQRVEVLVKGDRQPGKYRLLNLPYNRGAIGMGMMGGRGMMRGNPNTPTVLATVNYDAPVKPIALPKQLSAISALPEPKQVRRFELNHGMAPGMGMMFLINGKPFVRDRIDTQVQLNTVEDWEIVNTGVMDHPFHLHVNHFQVISRNNQPEPYRAWKDTVLVPRGETVRIRIPFKDFAGKTVYHCHILDHEDLGMMGNLMIQA